MLCCPAMQSVREQYHRLFSPIKSELQLVVVTGLKLWELRTSDECLM